LLLVPLLLAACAESRLAIHAAKRLTEEPEPVKKRSAYKVGQPYQVAGVWYYPRVQPNYNETGIASWYGDPFHGRDTALGEKYDMNELTAAHQTLPLPSNVRVTNLENGRQIVLRVNDRGPFVNGRIIDVSRRGAQLLGFHDKGTARVRVELEDGGPDDEGVAVAAKTPQLEVAGLPAQPKGEVVATSLAPPPGAQEARPRPVAAIGARSSAGASRALVEPAARDAVRTLPIARTQLYVQAGAFTKPDNAGRLAARLFAVAPARVVNVRIDGQPYYRVRLGPLNDVAEADEALQKVIANGIADAHIVVEQ